MELTYTAQARSHSAKSREARRHQGNSHYAQRIWAAIGMMGPNREKGNASSNSLKAIGWKMNCRRRKGPAITEKRSCCRKDVAASGKKTRQHSNSVKHFTCVQHIQKDTARNAGVSRVALGTVPIMMRRRVNKTEYEFTFNRPDRPRAELIWRCVH